MKKKILMGIMAALALVAFVTLTTIGTATIHKATSTACQKQSIGCIVYGLGDIHVIGASETDQTYQVNQALLDEFKDESKTLGILILAMVASVGFSLRQRITSALYKYWRVTRHWHIKFWDFLHQAISRGFIHSKTLGCV